MLQKIAMINDFEIEEIAIVKDHAHIFFGSSAEIFGISCWKETEGGLLPEPSSSNILKSRLSCGEEKSGKAATLAAQLETRLRKILRNT